MRIGSLEVELRRDFLVIPANSRVAVGKASVGYN